MPDKKLTDNEIIKAFKDCNLENATLYLYNEKEEKVVRIPTIEIFDLINRQKAEIKEWKRVVETWQMQYEKDKAEIERLEEEVALLHSDYTYKFVKEKAKAEAYKEFADKVYEKVGFYITETNDTLNKMLLGKIQGTLNRKHYLYGGLSVLYEINSMIDNLLKELESDTNES